jgi:hypothetical protein
MTQAAALLYQTPEGLAALLGAYARRSVASARVPECGLTPRSSGAPTAGHQARAGGTLCIFTGPGLASCRWLPLSSNARPRKADSVACQQDQRLPA